MTITSKQRAKLKSIASTEETIFQIGKNALSDELIKQLSAALEARELIKIKVLENCDYSAKELSSEISERTDSMVVQVIGTKIVLYRQNKNPKKRKIDLND
jgi:RNA-binding protein